MPICEISRTIQNPFNSNSSKACPRRKRTENRLQFQSKSSSSELLDRRALSFLEALEAVFRQVRGFHGSEIQSLISMHCKAQHPQHRRR